MSELRGCLIEIIERTNDPDPGIIIPNDVRINGQSLLATDDPIVVHEISTAGNDIVRVTLTLIARRVVIGAAPDGTAIRDASGIVRVLKDPA